MNRYFSAQITSLLVVCFLATSGIAHAAEITDQEEHEYAVKVTLAEHSLNDGNIDRALMFLKQSTAIPHELYGHESMRIIDAVSKRPQNPDGHIALGRCFANQADPRFNASPGDVLSREAIYEFYAAKYLSLLRINGEADDGISAVSKLRQSTSIQSVDPAGRIDLRIKILQDKWQPPHTDNYQIARTQDGLTIYTPSCSKQFDSSVLRALHRCRSEYPFWNWTLDGIYTAFMARKDEKTVEVSYGAALRERTKVRKEDSRTDLTTILPNHLNTELLNLYYRPETEYAIKVNSVEAEVDEIISGQWNSGKAPERGWWSIHRTKGKRNVYRIGVDRRWLLEFSEDELSSDNTFKEAILRQRSRDILFTALLDKMLHSLDKNSQNEWTARQPSYANLSDRFEIEPKTGDGIYSCKLKSGKFVTARSLPDGKIIRVTVDNKPDVLWQSAVDSIPKNRTTARFY